MKPEAWSPKLKCSFRRWRVTGPGRLALDMPEANCCDMGGAIGIAQEIMPEVERIRTYADGCPDSGYRKTIRKGWVALSPPTCSEFCVTVFDEVEM